MHTLEKPMPVDFAEFCFVEYLAIPANYSRDAFIEHVSNKYTRDGHDVVPIKDGDGKVLRLVILFL